MLKKYAAPVLKALTYRGTFDTDPETLVNTTLEILEGLIRADNERGRRTMNRPLFVLAFITALLLVLSVVELMTYAQ